jgi:hypothetical protein
MSSRPTPDLRWPSSTHHFLDPYDRTVGTEGQVAVGQQVAHDLATRLGDSDQRAGRLSEPLPCHVERSAFWSERRREVAGQGPDLIGVSRLCGADSGIAAVFRALTRAARL